jgi:flagellar motility protein MotE (MotC chaperone)
VNTRVLPLLLALLTVFIAGRIGMSFMQHEEPLLVMQQESENVVVPESVVNVAETAASEPAVLWGGLWLPSAEAAAAMPIDEEKNSQSGEKQDAGSLQAAREKMNVRERKLEERQAVAKEAEERASKRIAELTALETRIQDLLDQEKSINDKKIKRLTTVYEGMKAEKAAPVIAQMKMETVVKMFSRMNEKQVGKILSFLPPKQAVSISQALTQRIGSL